MEVGVFDGYLGWRFTSYMRAKALNPTVIAGTSTRLVRHSRPKGVVEAKLSSPPQVNFGENPTSLRSDDGIISVSYFSLVGIIFGIVLSLGWQAEEGGDGGWWQGNLRCRSWGVT